MVKEPAAFIGAIFTVAVIVLSAFGIRVTTDEAQILSSNAVVIYTAIAASIPIIQGIITRRYVSPSKPKKVSGKLTAGSILFGLLVVIGCQAMRQGIEQAMLNPQDFAEQQAQEYCSQYYAKQRGITLDQASDRFCAHYDQYSPWVKPILDALLKGEERASARDLRAE